MLKSTIYQSILFSLVVHIIFLFINFKFVFNLFQSKSNNDFGFHDSYFVLYHGIFDNFPIVAIVIGFIITFIFIAVVYMVVKWLSKFIFKLLN